MIYDLSPPLSGDLAVWPGDTPLSREVLCDMAEGDNMRCPPIRATVHLGSHADAPSHYGKEDPSIEKCSIDYYLGPCEVVHIPAGQGALIEPEHLPKVIRQPRILLATGTYQFGLPFREDFAALSPATVDWLHERGVRWSASTHPASIHFPRNHCRPTSAFFAMTWRFSKGWCLRMCRLAFTN